MLHSKIFHQLEIALKMLFKNVLKNTVKHFQNHENQWSKAVGTFILFKFFNKRILIFFIQIYF